MIDIVNLIYDTYISWFPSWLATDILVLFIGKVLVLGTVLVLFYVVFLWPVLFVIKIFKADNITRL